MVQNFQEIFSFPFKEAGALSHFYENYIRCGHANTSSGVRLHGFDQCSATASLLRIGKSFSQVFVSRLRSIKNTYLICCVCVLHEILL